MSFVSSEALAMIEVYLSDVDSSQPVDMTLLDLVQAVEAHWLGRIWQTEEVRVKRKGF